MADILERWENFVHPEPNSGCWLWMGALNSSGYGQFRSGRHPHGMVAAHRFGYEVATHEPIPDGLEIDHLCRVRSCVNPQHLEVVTQRENALRSPISPTAINARRTHCIHGHPFDAANTDRWPKTSRGCRACRLDRQRRYRAGRV